MTDKNSELESAGPLYWTFLLGGSVFAVWTIFTQVAMVVGISFRSLTYFYLIACLVAILVTLSVFWQRTLGILQKNRRKDGSWGHGILLGSLMLGGGVLSLGAIRPDGDDVSYISRTLYFLANPDVPMDLSYHHHALVGFEFRYPLILPYTVEHFWGFWSYLLNIPYLDIYHRIVPFLGGMAIPAAWYLVLRRFVLSRQHALFGATAIFVFLCIAGETHHSFGNFAFVRIWQGKAILLSIFVPLLILASIDWFELRSKAAWLRLLVFATASAGLTGTSLFFVPLLYLLIGISVTLQRPITRAHLTYTAAYFGSAAYLFGVGLYLLFTENKQDYRFLGYELEFPKTFTGQWSMVFGEGFTIPVVCLIISAVMTIVLSRAGWHKFWIGWLMAGFILVFNPWMMPVVSNTLTTDNAYWRTLYALPFPLMIGVASARTLEVLKITSPAIAAVAAGMIFVAILFNVLAPSRSVFGKVPFHFSAHKVFPADEEEIQEIIQHGIRGPMLAPISVSTWIPIYTVDLPQLSVRHIFLKHFAILNRSPEIIQQRMRAMSFIEQQGDDGRDDFERLLQLDITNVVIRKPLAMDARVSQSLSLHGFALAHQTKRYSLYTRLR